MGLGVRLVRGLALCCVVLGGILVGAGCVTVASSGVAVAQTANSIAVEGNRRVEADTIRSYFKPGPGGRLGPLEIDEALKALYGTGLFADVRINHAGGRLVVTVVENPVINRVAFEGNKKAKDEQLKAEVQSKPRGTLSRPTVQADVQRIIEIYHRSGRFDVHGRAEDHRAAEQSRRPGVRDHGRRQDRRERDPFRRRARIFARSPEGCDQDHRKQSAQLPADERYLRSGPRGG